MLVDEAAGMARERMREDIAWPQDLEHVGQDGIGIVGGLVLGQRPELAEMDVERQVERLADLGGTPHRLVAPAREAADLGMALDAAHQVGVVARRAHGVVDRDAVGPVELGVVVAFQAAHHVGRDEREHASRGGLGDIFAEAGEGQHRRSALVDHGGHAGMDANGVGVEAEPAADIAIDVGVGIDQAGQHQLAAHVDRLLGWTGQALADRGDAAVSHGDIEDAVEALGRIDDAAAPKQQVEWRGLYEIHVGTLAGWRILLTARRRDQGPMAASAGFAGKV